VAEVGRRHADYYRALAERADRPLRGTGHREWLERLEAEAGNLAAAVRWSLADDPTPLPRLFRVLWLFWELRDHMGEARAWVGQLLPAGGSLDPQAGPSCCGLRWRPPTSCTTTRRRWRPASAWHPVRAGV
jgi:hypothetical protein